MLSELLIKHLEAVFVVTGNHNKPWLFQKDRAELSPACHTSNQRGNTLDHCYAQFKSSYEVLSKPAFGRSDHAAIFLLPEYKQCIMRDVLTMRMIKCWSTQSGGILLHAIGDVDWDMY